MIVVVPWWAQHPFIGSVGLVANVTSSSHTSLQWPKTLDCDARLLAVQAVPMPMGRSLLYEYDAPMAVQDGPSARKNR